MNTTTQQDTLAAANKAAEEGGLPALDGCKFCLGAKGGIPCNANVLGGEIICDYCTALLMKVKEAEKNNPTSSIFSADRASRQVANKAEVEPVAYISADGKMLVFADAMDVLKFNRSGMTALYAAPPATTGASTAPRPTDDELWDATLRDRDAYHEWADKLADAIAKHFGVEIGEHSNQNLPWAEALEAIENAEQVGASTVLTDERIDAMHTLILEVLSNHRMVRMFEVEDGGLGNSYPLIDRLCLDDGADVESGQVEVDALAWAIADKLSASDSVAREVAAQAGQVAAAGLSEEQKDRIARNYFSEQWAVQHAKDAIHDALTEASAVGEVAVPEGFVIVPVKPTPKMVDSTFNHVHLSSESHNARNKRIYAAMIAAAPSPAKESK